MPEPERVIREVTFAVEGDGRTIEARIVPYNTPTQVVDSPHNGGTGVPYMERWLPGAFGKQLNAANRVYLNFEHEGGIRGVVGHGVALREAPDALYGEFRVHPGADGDKALHMVNEGVLTGLSIEAIPQRTERREGIIDRVRAHLDKVSLVRRGAYEDALVLAVREAPDPEPEVDEPDPDPAVDEALQRMGYEKLPRKISRNPWNPSRTRFTDEQWNASCLVRDLPILEPNGEVNMDAVKAASGRLTLTTGLTSKEKADAARKLGAVLPQSRPRRSQVTQRPGIALDFRRRRTPRRGTPLSGTPRKARHPPGISIQPWKEHMAQAFGVTRMRLERIGDERDRTNEKIQDLLALAEEEERKLSEYEQEQITAYRTKVGEFEDEILALSTDIERANDSKDISKFIRGEEEDDGGTENPRWATPKGDGQGGVPVYRNYAQYAIDVYATRYPMIAERAAPNGDVREFVEQAQERLERAPVNTLSSNVPGLVPPRHIAQIMDLINASRPVVNSGRQLALDRGTLTYPKIAQRPEVLVQASEKTEGGTKNLQVTLESLTAETYLGGGDISWQAMNWSSPDTLQLWFDLAAEAYARATESAACEVLESAAIGTVGTTTRLGTAGTENFNAWRSAAISAISAAYTATGGRAQTDTLYLSANRFFQLAGLGTDQTLQVSSVGALDIGSMTGTWAGLRVVGSYGFDLDTAIVGDSDALLVAETPGAPVQLRVVEPSIAGLEVGIVGAFRAVVYDVNRFYKLGINT